VSKRLSWIGTAILCYGSKFDPHMRVKVGVKEVANNTYQVDIPFYTSTIWVDNLIIKDQN